MATDQEAAEAVGEAVAAVSTQEDVVASKAAPGIAEHSPEDKVEGNSPGKDAPSVAGNGSAPAEKPGSPGGSPPADAVQQPDGSYILNCEDGTTLRWTQRPDGSWRRPERKRAGWVGDLEQLKYAPPPLRDGQEDQAPPTMMAAAAGELPSTGTAAEVAKEAGAAGNGNLDPGKKHDLAHRWCLWVRQRPGPHWISEQWRAHEFGTVEDFWCMIQYSHLPSRLENVEYSIFHHKVKPVEKESVFRQGGRWIIQLEARAGRLHPEIIDEIWRVLSMVLIGEGFAEYEGNSEIVRGASMTVRLRTRGSRVALWLSDLSEANRVLALGEVFRNHLLEVPGLEDLVARFEDYRKQEITHIIPQPAKFTGKTTAGIFQ